jgi:hypothetical protein
MQDKEHISIWPKNEKGQYHGYHDVKWSTGGGYKGNYINGKLYGYFEVNWTRNCVTKKKYYAI